MHDSALRSLAFWLLRATLYLTRSSAGDWGSAMLSELEQVENPRAALMWAIGSSWALVRISLRSVLVQGWHLFVSVLVLMSLLLIPEFRQGIHASITSWQVILIGSRSSRDVWERQLRNLAVKAEERKDAMALAFVATRLSESIASADAANRAVELDRSLTWVYYVVAVRNLRTVPYLQDLQTWSMRLKEWDPQNAAPLLLEAESIAFKPEIPGFSRRGNTAWQAAMQTAAQAPRFDDYLRLQFDSDRDVMLRYGIWDPLLFIEGFPYRRIVNAEEVLALPSRTPRYGDGALFRYVKQLPTNGWGPPPATARIVQVTTLLIPGSMGLLIIGTIWRRRLLAVGITGAVILFAASTTLYVAYLPNSDNFHGLIVNGDLSLLESVKAFHTYGFPIVRAGRPYLLRSVQIAAVSLVCMSWICQMTLWFFLRRARNT